MGMYTEFHFNVELVRGVPQDVIDLLEFMVGDTDDHGLDTLPDHEFFCTGRWEWMFRSWSYYFDHRANSLLRFDEISEAWYLEVKCSLKNYGSEIELFIDWIKPYVDTDGFLGFMRYEECSHPTLIYSDRGNVNVSVMFPEENTIQNLY